MPHDTRDDGAAALRYGMLWTQGDITSARMVLPQGTITATRMVHSKPTDYRIARMPDGSEKLQAGYQWSQGAESGVMWHDMPVVELNWDGSEKV